MSREAEKILFLDLDGPLTNARTMLAAGNSKAFDPIATLILDHMCAASGAQIVCTSVRAFVGSDEKRRQIRSLFKSAGLGLRHLHKDWSCHYEQGGDRAAHILRWLALHPEVTRYAVVEDGVLDIPNLVRVSTQDGMSRAHFDEIAKYLDFDLHDAYKIALGRPSLPRCKP